MMTALVAFLAARGRFEMIDGLRDVLLAPIDAGEAQALLASDQVRLMQLNAELATAYATVQAMERQLTPEIRAQVRAAGLMV